MQVEIDTMQLIYLYDLKAKNKRDFNRVKRRFYYHLNKLRGPKLSFLTKSVIVVSPEREKILDAFFKRFKGGVEVYKIWSEEISEL